MIHLLKRSSLTSLSISIIAHCSYPSQHFIICMHVYVNRHAFISLYISLYSVSLKEISAVRIETMSFILTNVGCVFLGN